ncbi:fibrocystin-L-like [Lineus longissimus]|uniref:fibrocystin-L-like n=1 Tax=Lineus longissimus TaxID=88925 RepID=UPI00315CFCCA
MKTHTAIAGLLVFLAFVTIDAIDPYVTHIDPSQGSVNGETRITIYGDGFAADQFEDDLGNTVTLVSDLQSYDCPVHKDGSTEVQIQCYSPKMPEADYRIAVNVNGVQLTDRNLCESNPTGCEYKPSTSVTPMIGWIEPRSGPPGTIVTIHGRWYTSRYQSNEDLSTNGREEVIKRVYFGGQKCELRKPDSDEFYGIALNSNGTGNWGHVKCKLGGTYVGNINASFIIEGQFGRSLPDLQVLQVTAQNKISMFQTFAVISGVSPAIGSTAGETNLTIRGNFFDETDANARVEVGGAPCSVLSLMDTEIVCKTPVEQLNKTVYPGNRGVLFELWDLTDYSGSVSLSTIASLTEADQGYSKQFNDSVGYISMEPNWAGRMTGFFVPPQSGDYTLYIVTDDIGELYFSKSGDAGDKELIASCPSASFDPYKHPEQKSERMTLQEGKPYYFEAIARNYAVKGILQVAAFQHNATFTSAQTISAQTSVKEVTIITDPFEKELQLVTLENWPAAESTPSSEVQLITLTGLSTQFQLRLDGVSTGVMTFPATAAEVEAALNTLPTIFPDTVNVSRSQSGSTYAYEVTFNNEEGDMKMIEVVGGITTSTVTEQSKGVSSMKYMRFEADGVVSPKMRADAGTTTLKNKIKKVFGSRCNSLLAAPQVDVAWFQDFENGWNPPHGNVISWDSFCGQHCVRKPGTKIFSVSSNSQAIDVKTYPWWCMAYKGQYINWISMAYIWLSENDILLGTSRLYSLNYADRWYNDDEDKSVWKYKCINMMNYLPDKPLIKLKTFNIWKNGANFADNIAIAKEPPIPQDQWDMVDTFRVTLNPSLNRIDEMKLTDTTTGNHSSFSIELDPYSCHHGFPLIKPYNTEEVSANEYRQSTWPSSTNIQVVQSVMATPPIGGKFDIIAGGGQRIKDIPYYANAETMKSHLEASGLVGAVTVLRIDSSCKRYTWHITFNTAIGYEAEIDVDGSNLTPAQANVAVSTVQEGGIMYYPIPGDMLRTPETTPQVTVSINKIFSSCAANVSCSFEWSTNHTATLESVSPTICTIGDVLTINGTGFDIITPTNNEVMVGGAVCEVTLATDTELTCTLGAGPAGDVIVSMHVSGKGRALGNFNVTYIASIASVSPTSSSTGGGAIVSISGVGFKDDFRVEIGGNECEDPMITSVLIECEVPSASSTGAVKIHIYNNLNALVTSGDFTYTNNAAVISAMNVTEAMVDGSTFIQITGSGFGTYNSTVNTLSLGGAMAVIINHTDTEVIAKLPVQNPGRYQIKLRTSTGDFADTGSNNISSIHYNFQVNRVSPSEGSIFGGTILTITGRGFHNNTAMMNVSVGDVGCEVFESTQDELTCRMGDFYTTHYVTNGGTHPVFGQGYYWSPISVTIEEGDVVNWSWEPPNQISGVNYKVCETSSSTALVCKTDGFDSGSKTAEGSFSHKFLDQGDYSYWSSYVEGSNLVFFRGTVRVVTKQPRSYDLRVKIGDIQAEAVTISKRSVRSVPVCSLASPVSNCDETINSTASSSVAFTFSACSTPSLNDIHVRRETDRYVFEFHGDSLGDDVCQVTATFMTIPLNVTSTNGSVVSAELIPRDDMGLLINTAYTLRLFTTLNIYGLGAADMNVEASKNVIFEPSIRAYTPGEGSCEGSAILTITGMFLADDQSSTSVSLFGVGACTVLSRANTELVCLTPPLTPDLVVPILVSVNTPSGVVSAITEETMNFTCRALTTPTLDYVFPESTDGRSGILINGTGFGSDPSALIVSIGGVLLCIATACDDTSLTCTLSHSFAGNYIDTVTVMRKPVGLASGTGSIILEPVIDSYSAISGSTNGGLLIHVDGIGFNPATTSAWLTSLTDGSTQVPVESASYYHVDFFTPPHASEIIHFSVQSGVTFPNWEFTYGTEFTPVVSTISPAQGGGGDTVHLSGTGFSTNCSLNIVKTCGEECTVTSCSDTEIECLIGHCPSGVYDVNLNVDGKGIANSSAEFTFTLSVSSVLPLSGSVGGGQLLAVEGLGLDGTATSILVCGEKCKVSVDAAATSTNVTCLTPTATGPMSCDIVVSSGSLNVTYGSQYVYTDSLTPTVSSVSPSRGGSGGGTTITVTGTNFGNVIGDVEVHIGGSSCSVMSVSDTSISCTTGPRSPSVLAAVVVTVEANGNSVQKLGGDNLYHYIDLWSSPYTWGSSLQMPIDGDMVVVPAGQTLMIDMDTPIIVMLLIKGGTVLFDDKDVELNTENVLIVDGGVLQIGTEENPHLHKATITLHGNLRATELPIYGAKCLAVRNGTLDLHGKPIMNTWTHLNSTVSAGSSIITVQHNVSDWGIGSKIAIASTGDRHSQIQNEEVIIASISADGFTITLEEPLSYRHIGEENIIDGRVLQIRAEVGLLSHNILFQGSNDPQYNEVIEACPDGFDTGEFATQTCFQGRFGEEMGSDQFGAHIMMHAPAPDHGLVTGRLENVELTYVGQAFRLGRYPIHFHLNGNQNGSYVRKCGIHKAFNRAVNIHGTHNVLVEHTVIFNIMGGAFFLEDGIETGNIFQYNLAIFVKSSTSLLNDDITPAAFWATNPDNTFRHNAAAGGTHFGFWYRMHDHPNGPSYTNKVCPRKIPLREFRNNTAHSNGWFGIWIFKKYFPMEGGCCNCFAPKAAVFESLTAWNNEKGAEWTDGGAIHFKDFILFSNEKAGIEIKFCELHESYSDNGPMVRDNHIIGHVPALPESCTDKAIVLPLSTGLIITGTKFSNFDRSGCAALGMAKIGGVSGAFNGGFRFDFYNTTWHNTNNRISFKWAHEAVMKDVDGTFAGVRGGSVVPKSAIYPTHLCQDAPADYNRGEEAMVCDSNIQFHRFTFSEPLPNSLLGKNIVLENEYGTDMGPFSDMRMTFEEGWMVLLPKGINTNFYFENYRHLTNISYVGRVTDLAEDDCVLINHNFTQSPDRFAIIPGQDYMAMNYSQGLPTCEDNYNGEAFYDKDEKRINYIISGRNKVSKRSFTEPSYVDRDVNFRIYQCYHPECIPPTLPPTTQGPTPDPDATEPSTVPPTVPPAVDGRPAYATKWSEMATWDGMPSGWGGNYGNGLYGLPLEGDDVKIKADQWVVVDTDIPPLNKLYIYGVLEFEYLPINGTYLNATLDATHIMIMGGRLIVGHEDEGKHFQGRLDIVLSGDTTTEEILTAGGLTVGAKAIGVFGGLDLHGIPRAVQWTKLQQSANLGSDSITLSEEVNWLPGDEIMITTSSFDGSETEVRNIASVDGRSVNLTSPLQYKHISQTVTSPELEGFGKAFTQAAEVALLSRNIRIIGKDHANIVSQAFGSRVVVGVTIEGFSVYRGWARISDIEFYQGGQLGYNMPYDPRYAMAWVGTGDATVERPSYLINSTFHHCFATAIGAFGAGYIAIENNVIHRPVGIGIKLAGKGYKLRHNLVANLLWTGDYDGRSEDFNYEWNAGIHVVAVTNLVMENNCVAGSQRAGYRLRPETCGSPVLWSSNEAHGVLVGVIQFADDLNTGCVRISGFTIWRAFDYGIYTTGKSSIELDNLVISDCTLGIYNYQSGVSPLSHTCTTIRGTLTNSLIVGDSGTLPCTDTLSGTNIAKSVNGRSWKISGGHVGVSWMNVVSGSNGSPFKSFTWVVSYPSMCGLMTIKDNLFYKFNNERCGQRNYAISTMSKQEDMIVPMHLENNQLVDVDLASKVFFKRASVSLANPSDCVDMVCDARQHCYIKDIDGSFLGSPGYVLPQAEYEWDGDPARGVGDYRIPAIALTDPVGNLLDVNVEMPYKGILGNRNCSFRGSWQAYECHNNLDYANLVIESLDSDTESRRLSPVAIIGDKYVDLLNGPQDHGWCQGYTCQERISTFWALVALEKHYDIYFTSTSPSKLQLRLLQVEPSDTIRVAVFYGLPYRFDVYYQGQYISPMNGAVNAQGQAILNPPIFPGHYVPALSEPAGSNFFDNDYDLLYIIVRGKTPIQIRMSEVLIVSFALPAMTTEEFFGENIVSNLAAFLGITEDQIRIVEAVSESSKRKKRATLSFSVTLEIGDPPVTTINSTQTTASNITMNATASPTDTTFSNATTGSPSNVPLSAALLSTLNDLITDAVQTNSFAAALNTTILSVTVTPPPPETGSPEWEQFITDIDSGNATVTPEPVLVPTTLVLVEPPEGDAECLAFIRQPWLRFLDQNGDLMGSVGSKLTPWIVTATLRPYAGSNSAAVLTGTTTAVFKQGIAKFTNLGTSNPGQDFVIDFTLSQPTFSPARTVASPQIDVHTCELALRIDSAPTEVTAGKMFDMAMHVQESSNGQINLLWRFNSWTAEARLRDAGNYAGSLEGATVGHINYNRSDIFFEDLTLVKSGRYLLEISLKSHPAELELYVMQEITALPVDYVAPLIEVKRQCSMRFPNDYSVISGREAAFQVTLYNELVGSYTSQADVVLDNFQTSPGSIIASFDISGTTLTTDLALNVLVVALENGLTVSFNGFTFNAETTLTVDGSTYTGAAPEDGNSSSGMDSTTIIILSSVVPSVVIIIVVIAVGVYITKKNKTRVQPLVRQTIMVTGDPTSPAPVVVTNPNANVVFVGTSDPLQQNGDKPPPPPPPPPYYTIDDRPGVVTTSHI